MSKYTTLDNKKIKIEARFVCKPLDSFSEIMFFLENPPPWRTLCKEMTPHSNSVIRNVDINSHSFTCTLEKPESFCHYDPDLGEVNRQDSKNVPKVLVCHDMANGYHDDCIIDGTSNSEAYTFYNWAAIDIFCYFSHHLITIPPVGWINIGHAHGVKVIGTVITEWADGIMFWEQVLASELQYQNVASALVAIAKTLKFDGYLLNIENKITKPQMLLKFVRYFHQLLHQELPHGTLLWYDSVTVQGNLNWQNKLNEKNKDFFDACDGLFTNYSWSVDDVNKSVAAAQGRLYDLYIGIDVWGRNFFGGGQFNTQEAIKVVHAAGCSVAIFAPAWTHEALTSDKDDTNNVAMAEDLDGYSKFLLRDRAFWGSIWPFLKTKLPCQIPFQTSFCRGQGTRRCLYGEVLSPSPWFNLRHQQYQPNAAHGPHGYLLTPLENLAKVQHEVHYKDKKGIIRVRTSFQQIRHELLTVNKDTVSKEPASNDTDTKDTAMPYNSSVDSGDESGLTANMFQFDESVSDDDKRAMKSKVKKLKHLFKQKSLRIANDDERSPKSAEEPQQPEEDSTGYNAGPSAGPSAEPNAEPRAESSAEPSAEPSTGRSSMVQPSVNLLLGSTDKARFGLAYVRDELECLQLYLQDSFTGGSCLKVNPSDKLCPDHRFTRLFYCDFACDQGLIFCVVTKTLRDHPEQTLNVKLSMLNAGGAELTVVLTGRALAQAVRLGGAAAGIRHVYPLRTDLPPVRQDLHSYLLLHQPGFYVPIDNAFGWTVRYYEISVPGSRITAVNLHTSLPQGGILLGHFGICHKPDMSTSLPNMLESVVKSSYGDTVMSYPDRCTTQ